MIVRFKDKPDIMCSSNRFNTHAIDEVIVGNDDWGLDSVSIQDLDAYIEHNNIGWKDLGLAFRDRDIIPDNFNKYFGEPKDESARKRGYSL